MASVLLEHLMVFFSDNLNAKIQVELQFDFMTLRWSPGVEAAIG